MLWRYIWWCNERATLKIQLIRIPNIAMNLTKHVNIASRHRIFSRRIAFSSKLFNWFVIYLYSYCKNTYINPSFFPKIFFKKKNSYSLFMVLTSLWQLEVPFYLIKNFSKSFHLLFFFIIMIIIYEGKVQITWIII